MVILCFLFLLPKKKLPTLKLNNGNASKPHISIFDKNEILRKYVFDTNLYKVSKVLKFEYKVYKNSKNRCSKHSVSSLF